MFWRTGFRRRRGADPRPVVAAPAAGGVAVAALLSLAELAPGERATITAVQGDGPLAQRMMQLGLLTGQQVELVRRAPGGDPIELRLMGYALSLRAAEARCVAVERVR